MAKEGGFFSRKSLLARADKWTKRALALRENGDIKEAETWEEAAAQCHAIIKENHDRRVATPYRASAETMAKARSARKPIDMNPSLRNQKIGKMYEAGSPMRVIAIEMGITISRVSKIIRKHFPHLRSATSGQPK